MRPQPEGEVDSKDDSRSLQQTIWPHGKPRLSLGLRPGRPPARVPRSRAVADSEAFHVGAKPPFFSILTTYLSLARHFRSAFFYTGKQPPIQHLSPGIRPLLPLLARTALALF